jgi:hypothetical protein
MIVDQLNADLVAGVVIKTILVDAFFTEVTQVTLDDIRWKTQQY